MKKVEKLVRNGRVAILISPSYGSGWYTWNDPRKKWMLWHKDIVRAIEDEDFEKAKEIAKKVNQELSGDNDDDSDLYLGALRELQIVWLPKGTLFEVLEYDGNEVLRVLSKEFCMEA